MKKMSCSFIAVCLIPFFLACGASLPFSSDSGKEKFMGTSYLVSRDGEPVSAGEIIQTRLNFREDSVFEISGRNPGERWDVFSLGAWAIVNKKLVLTNFYSRGETSSLSSSYSFDGDRLKVNHSNGVNEVWER